MRKIILALFVGISFLNLTAQHQLDNLIRSEIAYQHFSGVLKVDVPNRLKLYKAVF